MTYFVISQILMFIGILLIIVAFQIEKEKIFRLLFVISGLLIGIHFILLGGLTAALIVFVNTSRWLVSIFTKSKYWFWFYIILFVLSLYSTYSSWVSIIPFIAGVISTVAVFKNKQTEVRKFYIGVDILWILNNIFIFTPVGIFAHFLFMVSNIVGGKRLNRLSSLKGL